LSESGFPGLKDLHDEKYCKICNNERQIVINAKDLNNISRTNWQALDSMSDEDIDYSDIPPLTDEFFEKATLRIPTAQAKNVTQLEPDVIAWFKDENKDCQTTIDKI
jgi:hypothetical protein